MKTLPNWMKLVSGSIDGEKDKPVTLMLCRAIGDDFTAMTSDDFGNILGSVPPEKDVKLLLDCPGGYVSMGTAIYNLIRSRGNVDTCVIGCAASMGAIILQAGRKRTMMTGSFMMIHDPSGPDESLDVVKEGLVDILSRHSGMRRDSVSKLMSATTYMTPAQAKKAGFIDSVEDCCKNEFAPDTEKTLEICQAVNNLVRTQVPRGETETKDKKTMKMLLASLATAKFIPKAELNDEEAAAAVNKFVAENLNALNTENATLKNRVAAFEASQKTRVTAMVEQAVADKLIKVERKDKLIEDGLKDEQELINRLDDLRAAKNQGKPAETPAARPRNGAPAVPPKNAKEAKKEGEDEDESESLRAESRLPETTALRRGQISARLRELRGVKFNFGGGKSQN